MDAETDFKIRAHLAVKCKGRRFQHIVIALILLSIISLLAYLYGGFAFLDDVPYVAYGMFVCVFCDFAAALVSFAALIVFRPKKTKS